uniref:uncharacterized protein LOC122601579 n=1 Tax=Erigeron canadensis TaxID=72917 RepID=UPI001CB954AC|nr:uncharacterized protein LOC122601579 [Erigeron canadensis]
MDEGSTKRKRKKRGRSLIFKACFRTPSNPSTGKILASDDNLVYCDVSNNCSVEPEIKKSSSSRGRISRIFKAVLFDTAVKKRIGSKKHSKDLADSTTSSPGLEEKPVNIDNIFDENNSTVVKNLEEKNSLNDSSNALAPPDGLL